LLSRSKYLTFRNKRTIDMAASSNSSDNQQPPTEAHPLAAAGEPAYVRFGQYELIELIAHGGMGVVYKARDPKLKRVVALKTIRAGGASHPVESKRFRVEAEAVARLQHPNIVNIHDFGEHNGEPFFTMDYLAGGSLAMHRLALRARPQQLVAIIVKVARAVHYAHERNVVHRDIKPSNILLDERGEPKIGDFGLAKLLDEDAGISTSGMPLGTFAYMSPEQARGDVKQIGPASDIWGLGVVLYDMLTGQRPFDGGSRAELTPQILSQEPPALTALEPQVDPELESIVLKCLRKNASDRWESVDLLADALQSWLNGQPIDLELSFRPSPAHADDATIRQSAAEAPIGASITKTYVPGRKVPRFRRWFIVAGVLLLAVGLGLGLWQRGMQTDDETEEERVARQDIERQLKLGQPVQLLGESGEPKYAKWIGTPGDISTADGTFTIDTQEMAMLELVRDPMAPHFSISAYVRQNKGNGFVGLYVGRTPQPFVAGKPSAQWFASAQFADVGTQASFRRDPAGKVVSEFVVYCHCLAAPPSQRQLHSPIGGAIPFFPALREPADWRRIEVRMDAKSNITLFWGEAAKENLKAESVDHGAIDRGMMNADSGQPKFDPPTGSLWPRGGIGLFVWGGSASFKNVVINH
jgi:serine/threonine protein kinase